MSNSHEIFQLPGNWYVDLDKKQIINEKENQYIKVSASRWRMLHFLIANCNKKVSQDELVRAAGVSIETVTKNLSDLRAMGSLRECLPYGTEEGYILELPPQSDGQIPVQRPALKSSSIQNPVGFVTHPSIEEIFDAIDAAFDSGGNAFFLHGMGGIGKTTIARRYAASRRDKFSTVVFAQIDPDTTGDTIENAVINDGTFVLLGFANRNDYFSKHNRYETDSEYFERKLAKIKQITDKNTLLVFDNLDAYSASRLQDLLSGGSYRVLITTRINVSSFGFPVHKVSEISDVDYAKEVFFGKMTARRDINRNDPALSEMFKAVDYHVLTIELLAKVLDESSYHPSKILDLMINSEGLAGIKIRVSSSIDIDTKTPIQWISRIFDVSVLETNNLGEEISVLLAFMLLMPTRGIDKQTFMSWLEPEPELQNALNFLIRRNWLRSIYDGTSETISMHPIIKEVVREKITPSLAQVYPIIDGMAKDLNIEHDWIYHASIEQKQKYVTIVSALYQAFPNVDLNYFEFYASVQKVYELCSYRSGGIDCRTIVNDIKTALEEAEAFDSWRYGYILFRLGSLSGTVDRETLAGLKFMLEAEPILKKHSKSNAEKLQIAILYRTMAATHSRLLYETNGEYCPEKVDEYAQKGLDIIGQLKASGEDSLRIRNYPGTIHVWQSKARVFAGDVIAAKEHLRKAYEIFEKNAFPNEMDRCALLDIESQIAEKQGNYRLAIQKVLDSIKVYRKGFQEKQKPIFYRYCTLADLYLADHQWEHAVNTLKHCKELMCDLYEHGSDRRTSLENSIKQKLTFATEHMKDLKK